jgi:enamine deaminase RidA (YjgF/YER057c/UK114 family)
MRPRRRGPGGFRTLHISGLNGFGPDGVTMPGSFEEQAEQVWGHLATILADAGLTDADLVSLRFYLADPAADPPTWRSSPAGSARTAAPER